MTAALSQAHLYEADAHAAEPYDTLSNDHDDPDSGL
jgi:hypothetical protein